MYFFLSIGTDEFLYISCTCDPVNIVTTYLAYLFNFMWFKSHCNGEDKCTGPHVLPGNMHTIFK